MGKFPYLDFREPEQPQVVEAPGGISIMVITAHPDDMESWCAGTLALALDQGATIYLLLATSGDKGSNHPTATAESVATVREQETQDAAKLLGISDVAFLRYPDGDLENTRALREQLVYWMRRWQPHTLFTFDPKYPYPPYLSHRDHRILGRATLDAVYPLARDRLSFSEQIEQGLLPSKVSQVWLFASARAINYVDITKGVDRKIQARLAHTSQTENPEELKENWKKRAAAIGGQATLSLAESFTILYLD